MSTVGLTSPDVTRPARTEGAYFFGGAVEGVVPPPGWVGLNSGDWRKVLLATRQPCEVLTMSTVMSISSDWGADSWLLAMVSSTTAKKVTRPPLFACG